MLISGRQVGDSSLPQQESSAGGVWLKGLPALVQAVGEMPASNRTFTDRRADDPAGSPTRGFYCLHVEHLNFLVNKCKQWETREPVVIPAFRHVLASHYPRNTDFVIE